MGKILDMNKAILVGVCHKPGDYSMKKASLDELEKLAATAGIEVAGKFIQKRQKPDKAFYIGKGFLAEALNEVYDKAPGLVIFDNELSPGQSRNIEKEFIVDAIDRTEVILNIFHDHARTHEAQLQVKLAELEYQLPRLKRLWSHLDREKGQAAGSGGTARGMGEKQIEIDRRIIRNEIAKVKAELKKVFLHKETQSKHREQVKKVCLVGYTNAGKSTLFNRLTDAGVLVENKLFATLSTTTRKLALSKGRDMILSDTVGFISNLPHHLVASFRATLKDVVDADLLLHVVDSADELFPYYIDEVQKVLQHIGADEVQQILVMNKADTADRVKMKLYLEAHDNSILISAKKGENIEELLQKIDDVLHNARRVEMLIPHTEQKAVNLLHNIGEIESTEYLEKGVKVTAIINQEDLPEFEKYII
ncbi:MAG: GTPase HflX [Candidatus Cloacimonetes bacterium]|nr:GTPase HflX [Candidatus Cloacimonadota bacterium]MCF7814947.1 GTPase HflX [Candidatus Cloacimonadota bacterium]MCF7867321.1 GTPase HflX [Candidatus Cloacimonadota bacterium]MCF7884711.1 GTPase HflX [Candidatus Cloacimonadota bacterium]